MKYIISYKYLFRKHYRDKARIRSISSNINKSFDGAYATASAVLDKQINEAKNENILLEEKMNSILSDIENSNYDMEIFEDQEKIFEKAGANTGLIDSNKNELLSLSEMRVIYLFKTIENAIKEIIGIAFSKTSKKDFFRWESLVSYLKTNDIEFKELSGYREVNQLRILNNNIKHSNIVNEETRSIRCMKNEEEFTYQNLKIFYNNIHESIMKFMVAFGESIVNSVYEIDDIKLQQMSKDIFDRLDRKQVKELILKLERQLQDNPSKYVPCKKIQ